MAQNDEISPPTTGYNGARLCSPRAHPILSAEVDGAGYQFGYIS